MPLIIFRNKYVCVCIYTHTHVRTYKNMYIYTNTFPDKTAICFSASLRLYYCIALLKSYLYYQRQLYVNSNIVQLHQSFLVYFGILYYLIMASFSQNVL